MSLKIGGTNIVKAYRGSTEIAKVYAGAALIYEKEGGEEPEPTFEDAVIALLGAKLRAFWLYDEPSHLWQDTSGTTAVTSDTDPVGRVDDLSGNGKHLLQATGGNKPAYRTGPSRTVYDGANDHLTVAAAAFPIDEFELFQVVQPASTSTQILCTFGPATGNDWNQPDALHTWANAAGSPNRLLGVFADAGVDLDTSYLGVPATNLILAELRKTVATCTPYLNTAAGTTDSSFTALTTPHGGMFVDAARITAAAVAGPYGNINRRCMLITAPLTTEERGGLHDLINARYSLW